MAARTPPQGSLPALRSHSSFSSGASPNNPALGAPGQFHTVAPTSSSSSPPMSASSLAVPSTLGRPRGSGTVATMSAARVQRAMPVCASCGAEFTKATAKFCAKCGAKKAAAATTGASASSSSQKTSASAGTGGDRLPTSSTAPSSSPDPTSARDTSTAMRKGLKGNLGSIGDATAPTDAPTGRSPKALTDRGPYTQATRRRSSDSNDSGPRRRSSASHTIPFLGVGAGGLSNGPSVAPSQDGATVAAVVAGAAGKLKNGTAQRKPAAASVVRSTEGGAGVAAGPAPLLAADILSATTRSPLPGAGASASAKAQDQSVLSTTSPHHRDVTALPLHDDDSVNDTLPPVEEAVLKPAGAAATTTTTAADAGPLRSRSPSLPPVRSKSANIATTETVPEQKRGSDADRYGDGSATATTATTMASGTLGSLRTIEASPEEEAQYTAWATLGPEGLTPEMLQTRNANTELKAWRRGSLIGRGTYGSVYLGLLPDGSFYAVKCVELGGKHVADMAFNVRELVSLSREINMMQRLRHPNLCSFKGVLFDTERSSICMFMEYVGGGSLSSIVKRFKPLPDSVVRRWTRQLLSGLLYLHSQHIIHRDVKGENVLIDTNASPESEAQVKLVDFGAARRLTDAVSQSRTVIGTPYWMAPEVVDVTGEGKGYSYKADVWSVGCTVAEMLTGRPPWPAKSNAPAAILMIAASDGMPTEVPREEASPGCYAFMLRCFERDPEKRPTVEELLQDPWIRGKTD